MDTGSLLLLVGGLAAWALQKPSPQPGPLDQIIPSYYTGLIPPELLALVQQGIWTRSITTGAISTTNGTLLTQNVLDGIKAGQIGLDSGGNLIIPEPELPLPPIVIPSPGPAAPAPVPGGGGGGGEITPGQVIGTLGMARRVALKFLDPESTFNRNVLPALRSAEPAVTDMQVLQPEAVDAWTGWLTDEFGTDLAMSAGEAILSSEGLAEISGEIIAAGGGGGGAAVEGALGAVQVLQTVGVLLAVAGGVFAISQGNIVGGVLGISGAIIIFATGFWPIAIPIAIFALAIVGTNTEQLQNQIHEHASILRGMAAAWPQRVAGARTLFTHLFEWGKPKGDLIQALQEKSAVAFQGIAAGAGISHFISTGGGREGAAGIPGADTSWYYRLIAFSPDAPPITLGGLMEMDNLIAVVRIKDALAKLGARLSSVAGWDTETEIATLSRLMGYAGIAEIVSQSRLGELMNRFSFMPLTFVDENTGQGWSSYPSIAFALEAFFPSRIIGTVAVNSEDWASGVVTTSIVTKYEPPGSGGTLWFRTGKFEDRMVEFFRRLNLDFNHSWLGARLHQIPKLPLTADGDWQQFLEERANRFYEWIPAAETNQAMQSFTAESLSAGPLAGYNPRSRRWQEWFIDRSVQEPPPIAGYGAY